MAVAGSAGLVNIYDTANYTLLKVLNTNSGADIFAVRLSDDSRYLLVGANSGQLNIYYRSDYYHFNNCS